MIKTCEKSCEWCVFVDRGYDDCCHEVFWVTERCPLTEILRIHEKVLDRRFDIEWITRYTGCVHFKLDEAYKLRNEELDKFMDELKKARQNQDQKG